MTNPQSLCRHKLPDPEAAGAENRETILRWAEQYPHLRPCPRCKGKRGTWNWVAVKKCGTCIERKREEGAEAEAVAAPAEANPVTLVL